MSRKSAKKKYGRYADAVFASIAEVSHAARSGDPVKLALARARHYALMASIMSKL